MLVRSQELDTHEAGHSTVDETESENVRLCPAEVAPFKPCGKKMRRYRNGVTVCPDHGEMH